MEVIASILYARVNNVAAICRAMPSEHSAEFVSELRALLEGAIARENGIVAMARPDSVLAVFANDEDARPDHARRSLQAAIICVFSTIEMSKQLALREPRATWPPLTITVGVHLGKIDVGVGRPGSTSGAIRASGEACEIARALQSAAIDLRWSIAASSITLLAAGARIESGRIGSVGLPDNSFLNTAEITGLAPTARSRSPAEVYQALRDAIRLNRTLFERPQDLFAAASTSASAAAPQLTIEGYRVLRKIGQGGMAEIYLVSADSRGEKEDDLKVLKVMQLSGLETGDALQRFMQEFALLAQVRHPNVAQIDRQDFSHGHAFIAMEYFAHGDLRARIADGISESAALSYVKQAGAALDAIHRVGIVHRDLKPDNLMMRKDGSVALTDFGIAKHVSALITETSHDEVVGTPYYLSPEQALGQPVDHRCDLYSLGILLYEMLTGSKPYRGSSAEEILDLHINAPVPWLLPPHEHLQPVLERLMAKERDQRYASALELLADLTARGL